MLGQTTPRIRVAPLAASGARIPAILFLAGVALLLVAFVAPAAAANTGAPLAEGRLEAVAKRTSGAVQIEERADGRYLVFSGDFRTGSGPDVLVLLHREGAPRSYGADDYVSLGLVQAFRGAQSYRLPDDLDLADFESVVLWCREFNVTFGAARLKN